MAEKNRDLFANLDRLMARAVPNFKDIEEELEKIPPAAISLEIEKDVGFTYLIDYYFRYIDIRVVKKILQNPFFTHEALVELFYCQITAIQKSILMKKERPDLFSSYWKLLSHAEYAIIFKNIIKRTSNLDVAKTLLQKVDLLHLRLLTKSGEIKSDKILDLFKKFGPEIKKLVAHDFHLYDFAFELALDNSDDEFLAFLEEYTNLFVQIRLASNFVEDIELQIKNSGKKLSYSELHKLCSNIPRDSLRITLEIFQDKGWISENENKSIDSFYLGLS
ncbi:MAG: hypothetical protein K8R21_16315 [Leptospira sp.]|nr:hypothetical protein [Leptospira sp.]